MSPAVRWADHVRVRARYRRSVHLERDALDALSLQGYVATPLVRALLDRIGTGLAPGGTERAWSLTGPYGAGKSAFALFLSQVFAADSSAAPGDARNLLARQDAGLARRFFGAHGIAADDGLVPILVTGERRPLHQLLLAGLASAVERFWSGRGAKPEVVKQVSDLARRSGAGEVVPGSVVVEAFRHAAEKVSRSTQAGRGLLVVLDEAGKALEHAAQHPAESDVQLLQELAEAASRSGDAPIVFVVVLHQAFEQYAGRVDAGRRNEWAKVQGRFQDLPFQEAPDQLLRLIGMALDRDPLPATAERAVREAVEAALPTLRTGEIGAAASVRDLLVQTAPLHPVAALVLGPLFRSRLAQNERSLFAFLAAAEPYGFQEFLATVREGDDDLLYPVDRLYDYLVSSYGTRLYGTHGKVWSQVEAALHRLPREASALDGRLVKAIGILGAVGEAVGLAASEETLAAAMGGDREAVRDALGRLAAASVVVYRKYRDAFCLWEGSDLDLDALASQAASGLGRGVSIVDRLMRIAPPRPLVARRHLFETGTLRYFEVRYADEAAVDGDLAPRDRNADGIVWLIVPSSAAAGRDAWIRLCQPMPWMQVGATNRPALVGIAKDATRIRDLALELSALELVQTQTPALQSDSVARRELGARLLEAERLLRVEVTKLMSGDGCDWIHNSRRCPVGSARDITGALSTICDEAFPEAPYVHNELLNRRQLSSAAAAARRELLAAMVTRADHEQLGMTGYPPEVSMYRSLLRLHNLHVPDDGRWRLTEPPVLKRRRRGSLRPAWDALHALLVRHQEGRVALPAIYDALRAPPFGMKDGVIPVLVVHAMILADHDVALYEDGAFVPALTPPVVERLLRSPEKFALQRFPIAAGRAEVFQLIVQALTGGADRRVGLVSAIRQLVRLVADLPDYSRNTKSISPVAQAVREALLRAKEPAPLLFRDLPAACGIEPFSASSAAADSAAADFVARLRAGLRELRMAYPRLLDTVAGSIAAAFHLPTEHDAMCAELRARCELVSHLAAETQVRTFMIRATDHALDRDEWLVSVGTLLAGKPPESWYDRDVEQMQSNLRVIARRFRGLEALAIDDRRDRTELSSPTVVRIAITQPGTAEQERVATIRPSDQVLVDGFIDRVMRDLRGVDLPRETLLAGLGLIASTVMRELDAEAQDGEREVME